MIFYSFHDADAGIAIVQALMAAFPLAVIIVVLVCIFGVAFWILETIPTKAGDDRTAKQMLWEVFEGVWWAFITMATVG